MKLGFKKKKNIPSHWEHLSKESRKLDAYPGEVCMCKGQWPDQPCDCHELDRKIWESDVQYRQYFTPPPVRPVNRHGCLVVNENGIVQGPYTHNEWLLYGFEALDLFQDVVDGKAEAEWSDVYFRHNDDYYSGNYK